MCALQCSGDTLRTSQRRAFARPAGTPCYNAVVWLDTRNWCDARVGAVMPRAVRSS